MGIKFSQFIRAFDITDDAALAGLQDGSNKRFTFGLIKQWIKVFFTPAEIGAQEEITANGILKGDGAGGVTAAIQGTDYATPAMIPTSAAEVGALPADGTAVSAETLAVSHSVTGGEGWYKFFEETVGAGLSRNYIFLITDTYSRQDGILSVFVNRNTQGTTTVVVKVLAGTIPPGSVRWEYSTSLVLYIQKTTSQGGYIQFRVMINTARTGNPVDLTTRWKNEAVSEPTGATSATADVLRFTAQVVTVGTAQQIISISDAAITADHAPAQIEFADPEYIPTGYAWSTADGSFTLTGTATAATTANILLIRKGN